MTTTKNSFTGKGGAAYMLNRMDWGNVDRLVRQAG